MKVSSLKFLLIAVGLVACVSMTSSCNKGYGCPSDFSVDAAAKAPASVDSLYFREDTHEYPGFMRLKPGKSTPNHR